MIIIIIIPWLLFEIPTGGNCHGSAQFFILTSCLKCKYQKKKKKTASSFSDATRAHITAPTRISVDAADLRRSPTARLPSPLGWGRPAVDRSSSTSHFLLQGRALRTPRGGGNAFQQ